MKVSTVTVRCEKTYSSGSRFEKQRRLFVPLLVGYKIGHCV
jgi:hypothetical protein